MRLTLTRHVAVEDLALALALVLPSFGALAAMRPLTRSVEDALRVDVVAPSVAASAGTPMASHVVGARTPLVGRSLALPAGVRSAESLARPAIVHGRIGGEPIRVPVGESPWELTIVAR